MLTLNDILAGKKKLKKPVRIKAVPYPKNLEVEYYRELKAMANNMKRFVVERILPNIKEYTADGSVEDLAVLFQALKLAGSQKSANQIATDIIRKIDKHNYDKSIKNIAQRFGVDMPAMFAREGIEPLIKLNIAKNVTLIKSIPEEFSKNIESIIYGGISQGLTYKAIEQQILGTEGIKSVFGKLENRVKLIARNEVGNISGQINKTRMENIGITKYEWVTAGDERVRDSHAQLDGQIFSWDNPPSNERGEKIIPASDYNCRCQSIAVFTPQEQIEE